MVLISKYYPEICMEIIRNNLSKDTRYSGGDAKRISPEDTSWNVTVTSCCSVELSQKKSDLVIKIKKEQTTIKQKKCRTKIIRLNNLHLYVWRPFVMTS